MDDHDTGRAMLESMLRPYRLALFTMVPFVGTVGAYGYEVVAFMHRDKTHEEAQDRGVTELQKENERQKKAIERQKRRQLEMVQLMLSDLDLLRSKQIELLPEEKREKARQDFDAQRAKSIRLLIDVQSDP